MASEKLYIGQTYHVDVLTYNARELPHVLANITTMVVTVKSKAGNVSTYTYPDGGVVKTATGTYYYQHPIADPLDHQVTQVAAGAYPSVDQWSFYVQPRNT